MNKYGQPARDPANDTFGVGTAGFICGACHTNTVANHRAGSRLINFNDDSTTYRFINSGLPTYNVAGASDPKTCSNISCHFTETPQWEPH
jgi:hypothetical protein